MERFFLVLAATVGGIVVALIGWWDAHEPFDAHKFGASALRALVAGGIFAAKYEMSDGLTFLDILACFLGGAGFDVVVNRFAGALGWATFPLPSSKKEA